MSSSQLTTIEAVSGTGCVLRGDDIDTDRIIPARFMKDITFDDMGNHLFEDARKAAKGNHPLDDERFFGSEILVVGKNFGCGSSREHAPQSLMRFGFRAVRCYFCLMRRGQRHGFFGGLMVVRSMCVGVLRLSTAVSRQCARSAQQCEYRHGPQNGIASFHCRRSPIYRAGAMQCATHHQSSSFW